MSRCSSTYFSIVAHDTNSTDEYGFDGTIFKITNDNDTRSANLKIFTDDQQMRGTYKFGIREIYTEDDSVYHETNYVTEIIGCTP